MKRRGKYKEVRDKELMDLAKSEPFLIDRSNEEINDVEKFIIEHDIKDGIVEVPAFYIYDMYYGWSKRQFNRPKFFQLFRQFFKSKKTKLYVYYYLDPDPFDNYFHLDFWSERRIMRRQNVNQKSKKYKKIKNK